LFTATLKVELRLRGVSSLKEKRSIVRPILDGSRRRFAVAAAEVARQDAWQLATLGFAAVSGSHSHAESVLDTVERFVWSFPEVDVVSVERSSFADGGS
jgi:uncharacterized protein YlxP (DUF503 family)